VDPESRRLVPLAGDVLAKARERTDRAIEHELQLCQVETGTAVCATLDELAAQVAALRRDLVAAAADAGCRVASAGTHPLPLGDGNRITPKPAYLRLEREYGVVGREQVLCGCHVHVGVAEREAAVAVMNRSRRWLPVLLALSTNSPYWQGEDTGYASFRTEMWRRWPISGPPEPFSSRSEYDDLVRTLLTVGAIDDPARVYFDIRPSARFATLEFRVADAALTVGDTVTVAGLTRALVRTCHADATTGRPAPALRPELLRSAMWRAARYGVAATLVDFEAGRSRPAPEVVDGFLSLLRPALEESGEWDVVRDGVARILRDGSGAARQRAVFTSSQRLDDVVDFVVRATEPDG
jgi:carboxylate-amine ligase